MCQTHPILFQRQKDLECKITPSVYHLFIYGITVRHYLLFHTISLSLSTSLLPSTDVQVLSESLCINTNVICPCLYFSLTPISLLTPRRKVRCLHCLCFRDTVLIFLLFVPIRCIRCTSSQESPPVPSLDTQKDRFHSSNVHLDSHNPSKTPNPQPVLYYVNLMYKTFVRNRRHVTCLPLYSFPFSHLHSFRRSSSDVFRVVFCFHCHSLPSVVSGFPLRKMYVVTTLYDCLTHY